MISSPLRILQRYGLPGAIRNPLMALVMALLLSTPGLAGEPTRIVALGDSLTAGYGLEQGEGLVPQLQRWLDDRGAGPVEVVNMGVSGDTTAGGLARLDWALGGGADAVILALGANDMLRGVDPDETRANLEAILEELSTRELPVLIVGMRASANFGADYQARFDTIYPELAERHDALYDPFFFEGLIGGPENFQPDGMHPSADGVAVVVERLGPLVLDLIERARQ